MFGLHPSSIFTDQDIVTSYLYAILWQISICKCRICRCSWRKLVIFKNSKRSLQTHWIKFPLQTCFAYDLRQILKLVQFDTTRKKMNRNPPFFEIFVVLQVIVHVKRYDIVWPKVRASWYCWQNYFWFTNA